MYYRIKKIYTHTTLKEISKYIKKLNLIQTNFLENRYEIPQTETKPKKAIKYPFVVFNKNK